MNLMFIGNPGSGKSTTCNAILGQVAFNSGLHTTGLTTESSQHPWEHEGVMHAITDTPGLADVNMRKEAAEEISKALKGDIIYKIFFVVTLESGRVRPADLTTIDLVLDCLPDKGANIPVSVIVTKMSKKLKNKLAQETGQQAFAIAFATLQHVWG